MHRLLFVGLLFVSVFAVFATAPVSFDDAYITFRYAKSLVLGHGLVFNMEDGPVEGFTNLLWVLLNALAIKVSLEPLAFSQTVGLASLALALLFLFPERARVHNFPRFLIALSLSAVSLRMHDFVATAGSGLETSFAGFLTVMLGALLREHRTASWSVYLVGVALLLTRPDGAIFLVAAAFALSIPRAGIHFRWPSWKRERIVRHVAGMAKHLLLAALPVLLVTAFRLLYFGSWFPNTYYAKNADVASWDAGWAYWHAFVQNSPHVVVLVLLWLLSAALIRRRLSRLDIFGLLGLSTYVLYVARVGGDFMFYRFAFQVTPLLFYIIAVSAEDLRGGWLRSAGYAVVVVVAAVWGSSVEPVFEAKFGMQSVALMNDFVAPGREVGLALKRNFPPSTRISTTLAGTVPYYSDLFAVDEWGLNDVEIARRPSVAIPERGRGHLKRAPSEYLEARRVDVEVGHPVICDCQRLCDDVAFPQIYVPLENGQCLRARYRSRNPEFRNYVCSSKMTLRHVDCRAEPIPGFIDAPQSGAVEVREAVGTKWVPVPPSELLQNTHGVAFGREASRSALLGQQPISGVVGAAINSFHGGDETVGWVEYPLPPNARSVAMLIGGGSDCSKVFAAIVSKGQILSRGCGAQDEILRPLTLTVPALAQSPRLVLMDAAEGSWGHLIVSDVRVELPE